MPPINIVWPSLPWFWPALRACAVFFALYLVLVGGAVWMARRAPKSLPVVDLKQHPELVEKIEEAS